MSRNVLLALCFAFMALTAGGSRRVPRGGAPLLRTPVRRRSQANRRDPRAASEVVVVSSKEADVAAKKLGADANSPEGRKVVAKDLRSVRVGRGHRAEARSKLRLTVLVYDGANHDRVGRTVMTQRTSLASWPSSGADSGRSLSRPSHAQQRPARPAAALRTTKRTPRSPEADSEESDDDEEKRRERRVFGRRGGCRRRRPSAESPVRSTSTATAFLPSFTPTLESQNQPRNDAVASEEGPKRRGEIAAATIGLGSPYRNLAYNDVVTPEHR